MENNVLSPEERLWVTQRMGVINQLANNTFAGDIMPDERAEYHRIAQKAVGFGFQVSWTCGSCAEKIGIYIKTAMGWH